MVRFSVVVFRAAAPDRCGEDLLLVEVSRRLMVARKKLEALNAPHPNSVLGKIDELTAPFNASESVRMYLAVAADDLWTLLRYVSKTREVPMVAAYSLIRSAVEATSYGIWVLKGNGNDIKAQRSLRISLGDFRQHSRLQKLFDTEEFDVTEIEKQILSLNARLKGVSPEAIEDEVQATSIVTAADGQVRDRFYFSGLQVWRSTSGLSHASLPAISVLLERRPDGMRTSRMTFVAGFAVAAIENMEFLLNSASSASADLALARQSRTQ